MRKAQSTLEYCLIFALLLAALLSMSIYIRRAHQGSLRQSGEQLGGRYSPKHTSSDIIHRIYTGEIATTQIREAPVVIDGENKTEVTVTTEFDREDTADTSGWEQIR